MLFPSNLTTLCAIKHKSPKDADDTKRFAHCEIGYSFNACEPITLERGHHICKEGE